MYISGINDIDSINGKGVGIAVYVSGCTHNCKGCFNPETWRFDNGELFTNEKMTYIIDLVTRPYIDYFSVLGGDPFEDANMPEVLYMIKQVRKVRPDIIINIWSGWTYEELLQKELAPEILDLCNILVDGEFKIEQRNLKLEYRGSENQRVIDLVETRRLGRVVTICNECTKL